MSEAGRCPACPEPAELTLWRSERAGAAVDYCEGCGVWVKREVIDVLGRNARADLLPLWIGPPLIADEPRRTCPECGVPMERKACGNIVVDVCGPHGVWLDCAELEQFVCWLRERAEAHRRAIGAPMPVFPGRIPPPEFGGGRSGEIGAALVELLLGFF